MKDSIRQRLLRLADRYEEVGRLLSSEEVAGGSRQFRELSVEYARLQPLAERLQRYHGLERDVQAARELQADADAGMRALGSEELTRLQGELDSEELELRRLLLPKDLRDERNIFLEVRAGTGGDEAAIFAGDLYRMYARYAESKGLSTEILSESAGEHGGYKEIISRIAGEDRRLVAAGAGAHLEEYVALVTRILRQQEPAQLGLLGAELSVQLRDLLIPQRAQLRVGIHLQLAGRGQVTFQPLIAGKALRERLQPRVLHRQLAKLLRAARNFLARQQSTCFFEAVAKLLQALADGILHG